MIDPLTGRAVLSPRSHDVLVAIKAYIRTHGYPPALRDIMRGADISTTSVVSYHLRKLELADEIVVRPGIARGILIRGDSCPTCGKSMAE